MENKNYTDRINSVIASFNVEGIVPSKKALDYCMKRAEGKANCNKEVEDLKRKYTNLSRSKQNVF